MNMRQQLRLAAGIEKPAICPARAICPEGLDALASQLARGWRNRCRAAAAAKLGGCAIHDVAATVAEVADVLQLPAPTGAQLSALVRHVLHGFDDEGLATGWWPAEDRANFSWGDK